MESAPTVLGYCLFGVFKGADQGRRSLQSNRFTSPLRWMNVFTKAFPSGGRGTAIAVDEVFPPFVSVKPFATADDRWSPLQCMAVIVHFTVAV